MKRMHSEKFNKRKNTFVMKETKSTWFKIGDRIFRQRDGFVFFYPQPDMYYTVDNNWVSQRFGFTRETIDKKWLKLRGWL